MTNAVTAPVAAASAPRAEPAPDAPAPPRAPSHEGAPGWSLTSFAAVVDLAREEREAILYGHLVADVHLVRFVPGQIEIRLADGVPGDLVRRLRDFLARHTGQAWLVTISHEAGEPTLIEQRRRIEAERRKHVEADPLVRAVLAAFPGARLGDIHVAAPALTADAGGGLDDSEDGDADRLAGADDEGADDEAGLDDVM